MVMENRMASKPSMSRLHSKDPSVVRSAHKVAGKPANGHAASKDSPKLFSAGADNTVVAPASPTVHSTVGASVTASNKMALSVELE